MRLFNYATAVLREIMKNEVVYLCNSCFKRDYEK